MSDIMLTEFEKLCAKTEGDKCVANLDVERFGWSEGYLVEDDHGLWHFIDADYEGREVLPRFIKSRKDAESFIKAADKWYQDGHKTGKADAKSELRKWLHS